VEPASRSGGGDITAVPSQQPEGEINVTAGQSQQPQRERQKQWQSQKQLAHGAGKEGGKKKGQAGTGNLILSILFVVRTVIYICQHMHIIKLEFVHKPKPSYTFE
jgi:hypothetical protein